MSEKEVVEFKEEGQYTIGVDGARNHIRFNFFGTLAKPEEIPDYISHMEEAIKFVGEGFTTLANATMEKNPGFSVTPIFKKSFKMMEEHGLSKAAFVNEKGNIIHKMIVGALSKLAKFEIKVFKNLEEGEKWLGLS